MTALPLALFMACPDPFLSKQVLMGNPITACRKLPLNQRGGPVFRFQLNYPRVVTACVSAPMCGWARGCVLQAV